MLLSNENEIIRVLMTQADKTLVIDCIKRTMPKWIATEDIATYSECSEADLYDRTGMIQNRQLSQEEQRIAQEHFTMIAAVLPFIGNEQKRNEMIDLLSEHCSKQTIRKYLCLYLVYQDVVALAPLQKATKQKLTYHEKMMRWGLNKFFYTQQKNSLNTAYTLLLQAKYCDIDACNTEGMSDDISDVANQPNDFMKIYVKLKMDSREKRIRLCAIELIGELSTYPDERKTVGLIKCISEYSGCSVDVVNGIRILSIDEEKYVKKTGIEREFITSVYDYIAEREMLLNKVIYKDLSIEQIKRMYSGDDKS